LHDENHGCGTVPGLIRQHLALIAVKKMAISAGESCMSFNLLNEWKMRPAKTPVPGGGDLKP